ncbi:MAG TPA: hypothetical protein VFX73_08440, partial [Chitinophagaceae bacterium]|nr:hypothetical protein [Chitinophagaceae bacterium]
LVYGTLEIAVVGRGAVESGKKVLMTYVPYKVYQSSESGDDRFALLRGKQSADGISFFLCKNYSCRKPVYDSTEFVQLIEKEIATNYQPTQ